MAYTDEERLLIEARSKAALEAFSGNTPVISPSDPRLMGSPTPQVEPPPPPTVGLPEPVDTSSADFGAVFAEPIGGLAPPEDPANLPVTKPEMGTTSSAIPPITNPAPAEAAAPASVAPQGAESKTGAANGSGVDIPPPAKNLTAPNLEDAIVETMGKAEEAFGKADRLEALAGGDFMHWDEAKGEMVDGPGGGPDSAEAAAHISQISDEWKVADANAQALVSTQLQANLQKLQHQQEDIQRRYGLAVEEVANTYINPSEIWDKGCMGAKIGMAGSAFLDTWFAMKGYNVPSFSAAWDKAVANNIIAQKSKLEAGNAKVAGFDKLWTMAGQLATTEKERIDVTSDLMKANLLGQYVALLKPYKSKQAANDMLRVEAQAARALGEGRQKRMEAYAKVYGETMDNNVKRAELQLKEMQIKNAAEAAGKSNAKGGATGRGMLDKTSLSAAFETMSKWDSNKVGPADGSKYSDAFGKLSGPNQDYVVTQLLNSPDDKKGQSRWAAVRGMVDGRETIVGYYNASKDPKGEQTESIKKMTNYLAAATEIKNLNDAFMAVVAEAVDNGTDLNGFSTTGAGYRLWNKLRGDTTRALTDKQKLFQGLLTAKSLGELHKLSGGAVTTDEASRFEQYIPTSGFDASGALKSHTITSMALLATRSTDELASIGQGTGSWSPITDDANMATIKALTLKSSRGSLRSSDIDVQAAVSRGAVAKPVVLDKNISPSGPNTNRVTNDNQAFAVGGGAGLTGDLNSSSVALRESSRGGASAVEDSSKKTWALANKGTDPKSQNTTYAQRKETLKNVSSVATKEITTQWNTGNDNHWKGTAKTLHTSIKDAESLLKVINPLQQPALASAIDELRALKKESEANDTALRAKGDYDYSAATSEDSKAKVAAFNKRLTIILDRIYVDGGSGLAKSKEVVPLDKGTADEFNLRDGQKSQDLLLAKPPAKPAKGGKGKK